MSALPPKADMAQSGCDVRFADITSGLIDYFISAAEQRRRHGEAEHSGGLRIDDQIELVRFDNWQLRGLGALNDAANILTSLTKCIDNVGSVAYQVSDLDKVSQRIDHICGGIGEVAVINQGGDLRAERRAP